MTPGQIQERKAELKRQVIQARGIEQEDKIERAILLRIRRRYESQITEIFDRSLSLKIDCLDFLIGS